MGAVFEAFDRELNARVALKTLHNVQPASVYRIKNEFRSMQGLHHPNLVRLGELFEDDGNWFFSMELLDGVNFLEYVRGEESSIKREPAGPIESPELGAGETFETMASGSPSSPLPKAERRPVGSLDETRLRSAMKQLAGAVHALHQQGKVHRDIKPSNVLVVDGDRVVLLDFGLVVEHGPQSRATEAGFAGTPTYMAPEQGDTGRVGPAADWYALGVFLYRALTGVLPYVGGRMQIMLDKHRHAPPPARSWDENVPADLNDLCVDLLQPEPKARPSGVQVLRRLGVETASSDTSSATSVSWSDKGVFVGRRPELASLEEELSRTMRGEMRAVALVGQSGVGKSALAQEFRRTADARGAVVLTGRCSPYESMRYKALDGVVDSLSHHLVGLSKVAATALLPRNAGLLTRLFPVLGRVDAFLQAPRPRAEVKDPLELRTQAFGALRALLHRLADRRPTVLLIDDVQWADRDSLLLLAQLLRSPDPPAVMLIMTYRIDPGQDPTARGLDELPIELTRIPLAPLGLEEAEQLATLLLKRSGAADGVSASEIAAETQGHPLYIDELIRHLATEQGTTVVPALDDAIWERAVKLGDGPRRVLEMLAVRAMAEERETIRSAVGLDAGEFVRATTVLRAAQLIRVSATQRTKVIAPYHDRVREAVYGRLTEDRLETCHRQLVRALDARGDADPQTLIEHWLGAKQPERAGECAELAAEQAERAMAFGRAARNYELALELTKPSRERRRELLGRLGDARAYSGQLSLAAEAYLDAASDAPREVALDLRRRAVEQYLRGGRLEEGFALTDELLRAVGLRLPSTDRRALISIVWSRLKLAVRGRKMKQRRPDEITSAELRRLELCWSVVSSLNIVNPLVGAALQFTYVLQALGSGDAYHAALATLCEQGFSSTPGILVKPKVEAIREQALALVEASENAHAHGVALNVSGMSAFLLGEWNACVERSDDAYEYLVTQCADRRYEADQARAWRLAGLYYAGRIGELVRAVPELLHDAESRGDEYLLASLRTWRSAFVWLATDAPEEGRAQLEASRRDRTDSEAYHIYHYYQLHTGAQLAMYEGASVDAWALVERDWPALQKSVVRRVQTTRVEARFLHARCAVAAAAAGHDAERLLAIAKADTRALLKEKTGWVTPMAEMIQACLDALGGRQESAAASFAAAAEGFREHEMALLASVADARQGPLVGGTRGEELAAAAETWMRGEAIVDPGALVRLFAPGAP